MTRATVRTYRHGLGDCHLVTLMGKNEATYRILVDCGVILGTPDAASKMTEVMDDVLKESTGRVDLLVATHEHWDHVSGFVQAADSFAKLKVGEVWMAWTENPEDKNAKELAASKGKALEMLHDSALHLQQSGSTASPLFVSLAEFFGMAAGATTRDALEAVRGRAKQPRYCDPADPPVELPNFDARIYVLGPPRDMALLQRVDPSSKEPEETYKSAMAKFAATVQPALNRLDEEAPFAAIDAIPLAQAKTSPFFQNLYFDGPEWRRIDADWMLGADELALALDNMTNNTSLVLAIELGGKDVLLFAADAQVGNWLSWGDCAWKVKGQTVTGNDLLRRTIVYKVGHHGSVNATLKARGLELMTGLQTAVIPVDHDMAVKKKWGALPLAQLVTALQKATGTRGFVLQTDQPLPSGAGAGGVVSTEGYIEVSV